MLGVFFAKCACCFFACVLGMIFVLFVLSVILCTAQCVLCKVRCHCIFSGPGIKYSDISCVPGIRYSVIIKLPCALLQTGHLETVHAPVTDTVTEITDLEFENH